ncbi:MAG TPA: 2-dehydropantoate 2-reductase [Spirochaetota bacterium]|nr:2-dehydropantoate 2-reductase [Spirochaetota bacterium]
MKTGIAGAGAMGSLFASFFIETKIDTVLYEISPETVNCIKNELKIITSGNEIILHPVISDDPSILAEADIIFLFVKSYSTADAAAVILKAAKSGAIIVSLQNGLGNFEALSRSFDPERIVYGTTTFGAAKKSPSEVIFGGRGSVSIGGVSPWAVQKVSDLLVSAGLDVNISDNPERIVWLKALINAGINPIATILGIKNGQILENTYALQIQESILKEAVAAAGSIGLDFDLSMLIEETRSICSKTSVNTCSMLQDHRSGRKTEIDSINMKIVETGEAAGLDMKYNRMVSLIVKAMEEINHM